jgi:hypothetical protein
VVELVSLHQLEGLRQKRQHGVREGLRGLTKRGQNRTISSWPHSCVIKDQNVRFVISAEQHEQTAQEGRRERHIDVRREASSQQGLLERESHISCREQLVA